ncbi:MAG: GNAT family N-acetyltransferase, partial [Rhizobiaceae bacterium]|nr:GNAT family N-acetyltransferase [Rhizobiaceae bacterium]
RKQKQLRSQLRFVEPLGGAELFEARSRQDVVQLLECFHQQKSNRLRAQGLRDVFGSKFTHMFFEQMALDSLDMDEPLLKLFALKIDGKYRAIYGGGIHGKHFSAYFTSFADDELAHISPGEMLLFMLIKKLADEGFHSIDLGGGEERYKRSWCPNTIEMFDVIMPLSIYSHAYVQTHKVSLVIKRRLRENPGIWSFFKRMRTGATRLQDFMGRK